MEAFIHSLLSINPLWVYLVLFVSAFVENVFPPIPGDTVTIAGAYLVGIGTLNLWWVLLSTTAGSIAGFMTLFGLAFFLERRVIEKYQPSWISKTKLDLVEAWFRKYGYWVVLANRFMSGARSVISVIAGFSKMRPSAVFLLALISCTVWNGILISLGELLGKNWDEVIELLKVYNKIVLTGIVFLVIVFFVYKLWAARKKSARES